MAVRTAALVLVLATAGGCDLPHDAAGTLDRIRGGGTIRAGVAHHPPWVVDAPGEPAGIEPDLVRAWARDLGARVEWVRGSEAILVRALADRRIDVLVGGIRRDSPWTQRAGTTQVYCRSTASLAAAGTGPVDSADDRLVWLTAPGESAWLLAIDRFLARAGCRAPGPPPS